MRFSSLLYVQKLRRDPLQRVPTKRWAAVSRGLSDAFFAPTSSYVDICPIASLEHLRYHNHTVAIKLFLMREGNL